MNVKTTLNRTLKENDHLLIQVTLMMVILVFLSKQTSCANESKIK